jgi:hypothetical protein
LDYVCKPKTNDIELPTLRFMNRWIAMTLFPRPDPRTAREDELKLLLCDGEETEGLSSSLHDASVVGCFWSCQRGCRMHIFCHPFGYQT